MKSVDARKKNAFFFSKGASSERKVIRNCDAMNAKPYMQNSLNSNSMKVCINFIIYDMRAVWYFTCAWRTNKNQ
jgi:hypothetical protein